ncbi:MAG: DUF1080 domain-containing protein [Chryseolinea sp.]
MSIRSLRSFLLLSVIAFFCHEAHAQEQFYTLTTLPLNDLSAFKAAEENWKIVGQVYGGYDDVKVNSDKGTGIIVNEPDPKRQFDGTTNLVTQLEHGDIFLSLDFMIPKGSNSGIYLAGRYEIQLFDSWNNNIPHAFDCGSIYERWDESKPEGTKGYEGHPPRVNASRAPNLWQHLEIEYRAPRFDTSGKKIAPAQFVRVSLNGAIIHENVMLTGPTRASAFNDEQAKGPLVLQGDHGPVAFRNVRYALLDDFHVDLTELTYEYYEGDFNDFTKVEARHLIRKGKADAIDIKLADNPYKLCLVFTGKVELKENTDYQFIVKKIGKAKLNIDGEDIITTRDLFQDYEVSKKLSAGAHTIKFTYLKDFAWAPTGAGLFIGKLNSRPQALHTTASLPPLPPAPLIEVIPGQEPERVRSFMEHHGKKKTHVISVGGATGINYSYDLKQAGLMQVWKGNFLDATEMWYERGEPQLARAMGPVLDQSGKAPLALLATTTAQLPDTLDDTKDLIYKGYTLDAQRYPVFEYQYQEITFTDSFLPTPDGKGVKRTITVTGKPTTSKLVLRLGEGSKVTSISEGLYAVDDQRYFISFAPGGKSKPIIVPTGNDKALLWEINNTSGTSVTYTLFW